VDFLGEQLSKEHTVHRRYFSGERKQRLDFYKQDKRLTRHGNYQLKEHSKVEEWENEIVGVVIVDMD